MRTGMRVTLLLLLAAAIVSTTACSSTGSQDLLNLTPERWAQELRKRGVDPTVVPNPLQTTPAMREEAFRIAGGGTAPERLHRLQAGLFDSATFPFSYDYRGTLTAAEAFVRRQGNCLSFTNLFVALGRTLGVPVTTAMVTKVRGSEREGDLIVVNSHVIAALVHAGGTYFYDFDRSRDKRPSAVKLLDDIWITALYLNNRGADELRAGHPEAAIQRFDAAVKLAPAFAGAWGNLGVARRRVGDTRGAFAAYERALETDPGNPTVLSNLAALYRSFGMEREAQLALSGATLSNASPHVLILKGDMEMAQGRPDEALRLYRRARRAAPQLADAWAAVAGAELTLGRRRGARRAAERALHLDPAHAGARTVMVRLRLATDEEQHAGDARR